MSVPWALPLVSTKPSPGWPQLPPSPRPAVSRQGSVLGSHPASGGEAGLTRALNIPDSKLTAIETHNYILIFSPPSFFLHLKEILFHLFVISEGSE